MSHIVFDGDETLWAVEKLYDQVRSEFAVWMSDRLQPSLGPKALVEDRAREIDLENFKRFFLSGDRFPQSLVDTYNARCKDLGHTATDPERDQARAIGKQVFDLKAENLPGVEDTLKALRDAGHKLYLWTQGDEEIQKRRIADSGLQTFFEDYQIDDRKTPEGLLALLNRWHLQPEDAWMVGNSLRSDVQTAVAAHVQAIWIPAKTWNEDSKLPDSSGDQIYLLDEFSRLKEVFIRPSDLPSPDQGDVVYLFVSAYHNLYRQYVLDILANPRGFVIRFPYRKFWLPGSYETENSEVFASQLEGKQALIVFTDERVKGEPRRSPNFLPLRSATITRAEMHGDLIQIAFALGEYVHYRDGQPDTDAYDRFIKDLPYRPRLNRESCAYVALGKTFAGTIHTEPVSGDDDQTWTSTVRVLGDLRSYTPFKLPERSFPEVPDPFQYAMFFRVEDLTNLKSGRTVPLESMRQAKTAEEGDSSYMLDSDTQYRLDLLFFVPRHPESEVRQSKVEVKLAPEKELIPLGPTQIPLNFSYDRRHVEFATARTWEDLRGSIAFSVSSPASALADERKQPMTPAPVFLTRIHARMRLYVILVIIFLVGSLLVSLKDPLVTWLIAALPSLRLEASKEALQVFFATAGTVLTTFAVFLISRTVKGAQ